MSMHLEGPWLSTTGKKKGKKKWASAEAKAKAEALEKSWKDLLKRHEVEQ
jgi:N-acetylglucosamine-6-phosphate deacetylase